MLAAFKAAPYYDTASGMADSEESTESMGREAEHHSTDHEQQSPVAAAAAGASSKQLPEVPGSDKQQQQQQHKAASIADACHSHPLQPAAHSPSATRSSKKSRTGQLAGAR
jgi:hypothetical protein